jgi:hypothetical protein
VAGAQAIQIIVTVLLVATSAVVFVVAIGVFVALTLHKFGRLSGSAARGQFAKMDASLAPGSPEKSGSVARSGSAPRSGRGGRRFKSCHSDQTTTCPDRRHR